MEEIIKIALQPGYTGRELHALLMSGVPYYIGKPKNTNDVPVGSVEWVAPNITPNYYPEYLNDYLYRSVWYESEYPKNNNIFVKPADKYKRFDGTFMFRIQDVESGMYDTHTPPYWCSDIVKFTNEWRYYVVDGKVLTSGWYAGEDENKPAPVLPMELKGCGAFDFGTLEDGRLALVEWQHPYACGWYGPSEDGPLYIQWLIKGWKEMNKL